MKWNNNDKSYCSRCGAGTTNASLICFTCENEIKKKIDNIFIGMRSDDFIHDNNQLKVTDNYQTKMFR